MLLTLVVLLAVAVVLAAIVTPAILVEVVAVAVVVEVVEGVAGVVNTNLSYVQKILQLTWTNVSSQPRENSAVLETQQKVVAV